MDCRNLMPKVFSPDEEGFEGNLQPMCDYDEERNTGLFSAIEKGSLQKVKELLEEGMKTNITNRNNEHNTLLHHAVEIGKKDIVEELLCGKWETDVNVINAKGDTPLHIAASEGHKQLVQLLLSKQAQTDTENNEGKTPLELTKDHEIINMLEKYHRLLLKEQLFTKMDVPADGSCLFWATALAYLSSVKYADDAFHERFQRLFGIINSTELIKQMQELIQGYNPPLCDTTIRNNETLNWLVTRTLRNRVNDEIFLHRSKFEESITINDIFYTKNEGYVISGTFQEKFRDEFSSEISQNSIDIKVLKPKTLSEAAVRMIDCELDKVYDQNKVKQFKFTAYMECMRDSKSWGGNQEVQAISQMLGCNVHVFSDGTQHTFYYDSSEDQIQLFNNGESHYSFGLIRSSVLTEAIKGNEEKACETYITFGIENINYSNSDGWTPLHFASQSGNVNIIQLLLAHGARTDIRNHSNQTPLDVARCFKKDNVIILLSRQSQVGVCSQDENAVRSSVSQLEKRGDHTECRSDEAEIKRLSVSGHESPETDFSTCQEMPHFKETQVGVKNNAVFKEMQAGVKNNAVLDSQSSLSSTRTCEGQKGYEKGGTTGIKGGIYQVKLLMLFLYRAVEKQYYFRLATEMDAAEKFDDLVFQYTENNQKMYRFLQAKHKEDESKMISLNDLLTEDDGDFALQKYFNSYRKIKQKPEFQDSVLQDFIICTNINFKFDESKEGLKLKCFFAKVKFGDDILNIQCNRKETVCYRFKTTFPGEDKIYQALREASNLTRLARKLAQCVLYDKPIQHHLDNSIFKLYHVALAKEVINTKNKKFHANFLNTSCDGLSEPTVIFCDVFKEELEKEVQYYLQLPNAKKKKKRLCFDPDGEKDLFQKVINKGTVLKLSNGFGEGTGEQNIPNDKVLDREIEIFLDHLVFAVNQPNEVELGEIIKNDLEKEFNNVDKKNVYSRLLEEMLDWMKEKKGRFFSHEEGKAFFEKVKQEILGTVWFNVKDPVMLFTGREEELEILHSAMQRKERAAVVSQMTSISGLGGIGKSELARKYAYDHCQDYDGNVIWINAENNGTLEASFIDLARDNRLGIPTKDKDGKEKTIESIVKEIYQFFANKKSLFIFDNVETTVDLKKILPLHFLKANDNKPYILVTSHKKEWEGGIEVIELREVKFVDAVQFVKKGLKINGEDKSQEIKTLVEKLQFFPLAMQQAVAYIKDQGVTAKFGIRNYLKEYERKTKDVLNSEAFRGIDNDYAKTTFTTWKITMDKIRSNKECGRLALKILEVMAYLTPEKIDRDVFLGLLGVNIKKNIKKINSAVRFLVKYSMINGELEQRILSVHRLVQEVMRLDLKEQGKEEQTLKEVLHLIKGNIKKNLDHAVCAWEYASKHIGLVMEFCPLTNLILSELQNSVRYQEAYLFGHKQSILFEKAFGPNHPNTLGMIHNVTEILDYQGNYDMAIKRYQDVLEKSKRIMGPDHSDTLSTMHDIAVVLYEQGKYDEALKVYQEVLEKEKKNMRLDHHDVLITMQNMATVYRKQGNNEKALKIYQEVFDKAKRIFGPENPTTLMVKNNRAALLREEGKHDEALKELLEVLDVRKRKLVLDHPDTLYTLHDIALVFLEQKKI